MNDAPLPVTVIGGYLGAGKTTLVNHLLRHADGLRLAVLVNEFGALPIDADLIEAQDEALISISGGCVCCSYGDDLTTALCDLRQLDPRPEHVLVEASGVALPAAIAGMIELLPGFSPDGVVALADAETVRARAEDRFMGDTIQRQLAAADLVLANKLDLVAESERDAVLDWLRAAAPQAEIVAVDQAAAPPAIVLQSHLDRPGRLSGDQRSGAHAAGYESEDFAAEGAVDPARLAAALAASELGLLRAKGFVAAPDGALWSVQVVARRWRAEPAAKDARTGLVCIAETGRLDRAAIEAAIAAARRPA